MTTVAPSGTYVVPTILQLASRIRREVTKESLTSIIDDPINNFIVDSINDCVTDIYLRTRWTWSKTIYNIAWVANQNEYPLPPNFRQMAQEPTINNVGIKEVSAEEWWKNTFTPNWNSNSAIAGQPSMYMVDQQLIRFWPMPSTSFVSQTPTSTIYYYRLPSERFTISDGAKSPDVPAEFTEAIVRFCVAKLKIFLQESDFQLDQQRYEQLITNLVQIDILSVHPTRVRPRNWRSANFG